MYLWLASPIECPVDFQALTGRHYFSYYIKCSQAAETLKPVHKCSNCQSDSSQVAKSASAIIAFRNPRMLLLR